MRKATITLLLCYSEVRPGSDTAQQADAVLHDWVTVSTDNNQGSERCCCTRICPQDISLSLPADVLNGMAWIFSPTEVPRECPLLHIGPPRSSKRLLSDPFVALEALVVEAANPFIMASDRTMTEQHTIYTPDLNREDCSS